MQRRYVRDFQRAKVYRWEDDQWWMTKECMLSLDESRQLAWRLAGSKITVHDGRRRRRAGGCHIQKAVWLPRWSRNVPVICHEVAHVLTDDSHGPEFVKVYCWLLERSGLVPSAEVIRMTAIDAGVEVAI